jgi:membrane fusion protein
VPTAGLIKLYARETGTIVDKRVVEGQKVSKGDILFIVSMERRSSERVDTQATAMAQLEQRRSSLNAELDHQATLAEIEARSLRQKITSMESELEKLKLQLETQRQRVGVAEGSFTRYREMFSETLASEEMVEEKRKDLLEQQGKFLELERSRIGVSGGDREPASRAGHGAAQVPNPRPPSRATCRRCPRS